MVVFQPTPQYNQTNHKKYLAHHLLVDDVLDTVVGDEMLMFAAAVIVAELHKPNCLDDDAEVVVVLV